MLLNDDFLLNTEWARRLFHGHAEKMPIIDYHCHLDPRQIYEDVHFSDLAQLWLYDNGAGDHYKWRLMRANGTPERLITGDGEPYEKFLAYVDTIERAPGNPLYEWSHLELRRAFGIDLTICRANADEISAPRQRAHRRGRLLRQGPHPCLRRPLRLHHRRPGERPCLAQAARRRGGRERLQGPADLPPRRPHGHRQA